MKCPECGSRNINVTDSNRYPDSELVQRLNGFKRRRKCNDCGYRWGTFEVPDKVFARLVEIAREGKDECEI